MTRDDTTSAENLARRDGTPSGHGPPMQLRLNLVVEYDGETNTHAAWCDELAVATSAPTAEDAKIALVDAMRVAAEFVAGHAHTIGHVLLRQAPYAELLATLTDQEIMEAIDVRA